MAGGADEALSPAEFDAIAEAITGRGAQVVPPSAFGRPGTAGEVIANKYSKQPELVQLSSKLTPEQLPKVFGHEVGHVVDQAAGEIPISGVRRQADQVYNTLNTGRERTTNLMGPQHVGYRGEDIPRELMAEGVRAYMSDPNYLKSVAPDLAKRIREAVNSHPELSKIVQFNAIRGRLGGGAPAAR